MNYQQLLKATSISTVISLHAYKKRKLTLNASLTAFAVGTLIGLSGNSCNAALLTFFLTASKITSFGKKRKQMISEKGTYDAAGNRNVMQVLCNSAPAVSIILYDNLWSSSSTSSFSFASSRACQLAVIAQFAGVNGDTFSSEIGVLSKSQPRLVLNPFIKVPAGTNGGVTLLGLGAAALGGFMIGTASFATEKLFPSSSSSSSFAQKISAQDYILGSVVAAVGCSLLDSVLGMTLQYSGEASRQEQKDDDDVVVVTEDPEKSRGRQISGWVNLLSNDGVNLVSAFVTTVAAYCYYS